MRTPSIDVIIAVYNGEKYIEEAIASVQSQSWKNINIIVADDGSTDHTGSIILALSKEDNRISLLELPHRGVSATLNTAINYSSAEYIAFLDADDLWHKEKLKKQMKALCISNVSICFCLVQEFESFGNDDPKTHIARLKPMKGYSKTALLAERDIFNTHGLFDEDISIGDFVDWYSRIVRAGESVIMLDEVLTFRRVHQNNTTRTAPKTAFLSILKMHLDEKRRKTE